MDTRTRRSGADISAVPIQQQQQRQQQRKRARSDDDAEERSYEEHDNSENVSDEEGGGGDAESDDQPAPAKRSRPNPAPTSDASEGASAEPSQHPVPRPLPQRVQPNDAGIIESVYLENFMCHDVLEVDFNSNFNVITGPNGSGKSAILTAIQLALGARAAVTQRADKAGSFVKYGASHAVIRIRLRNQGADAYRREVYGSSIAVEKRIAKSGGSSTYKLLDARGRVVSRKAQELRSMLQRFNLHIDNPTTVMTQNVSSKFLAEDSPSEKYEFFEQATQLKPIIAGIAAVKENRDKIDRELTEKAPLVAESRAECERLKHRYELAQEADRMEARLVRVTQELAWAKVCHAERAVNGVISRQRERRGRIDELRTEREREEDALAQQLDRRRAAATQELEGGTTELAQLQADMHARTEELRGLKQAHATQSSQLASAKRRLFQLEAGLGAAEQQRRQALAAQSAEHAAQIAAVDRAIEELRAEQAAAQGLMDETDGRLRAYDEETARAGDELHSLQEQLGGLKAQEASLLRSAARFERSISDRLTVVSENTPSVLAAIKASAGRFQVLPIGPIGNFLTVKDGASGKWAKTCDVALRSVLGGYIANSVSDMKVLVGLLARFRDGSSRSMPSVFVQKFSPHAYSIEKHHALTTILDVVGVDEDVVRNYPLNYQQQQQQPAASAASADAVQLVRATIMNTLVDQAEIERIALVEGRGNCEAYMRSAAYAQSGLKEIMDESGTRVFKRGASEVAIGSNLRSAGVLSNNSAAAAQQQLAQTRLDLAVAKRGIERLDGELRQKNADMAGRRAGRGPILEQRRKCHQRIGEIARGIEDQNEERRRVSRLGSDDRLLQAEERIAELTQSIAAARQAVQQAEAAAAEAQQRVGEFEAAQLSETSNQKVEDIKRRMDALTEQLSEIVKEMAAKKRLIASISTKIESESAAVAVLDGDLAAARAKLARKMGRAMQQCPDRINTQASPEALKEQQQRLFTRIEHYNSTNNLGGDVAAVMREYRAYEERHRALQESFDRATFVRDSLDRAIVKRKQRFDELRDEFQQRVQVRFNQYLTLRGHSGEIKFDNIERKLDLVVHLDSVAAYNSGSGNDSSSSGNDSSSGAASADAGKPRSVATLSGGEKSFATVCLLLAMWDVVETPWCILDEVDVFMDTINRKTAMTLIHRIAIEKHPHRQFVLITPLGTTVFQPDEKTRINRLKAPVRTAQQAQQP